MAVPEIPLAIRLLAQEAETITLIFFFLMLFAWMMSRVARQVGDLQVSLPVFVMMAVVITRVIEMFHSVRRLASFGYAADDVVRGFRAVAEEHEQHRRHLQSDITTRTRRRSTVRRAVIQIVVGGALCGAALASRESLGGDSYHVGPFPAAVFITGVCLMGVSLFLLIRSPFRMNVNERLFRGIWLGPVGVAFLRLAMRPTRKEWISDRATLWDRKRLRRNTQRTVR